MKSLLEGSEGFRTEVVAGRGREKIIYN